MGCPITVRTGKTQCRLGSALALPRRERLPRWARFLLLWKPGEGGCVPMKITSSGHLGQGPVPFLTDDVTLGKSYHLSQPISPGKQDEDSGTPSSRGCKFGRTDTRKHRYAFHKLTTYLLQQILPVAHLRQTTVTQSWSPTLPYSLSSLCPESSLSAPPVGGVIYVSWVDVLGMVSRTTPDSRIPQNLPASSRILASFVGLRATCFISLHLNCFST